MPCLGLCLGLQAMTIEFARNVLGLTDANSTEFDPTTQHPVIDLMHDQRDVTDKGGTMRLGAYYAVLEPGTKVARGLRRAGGQRAPPPPLRVQLELPGPLRGGRVRVLRDVARPAPRRVHRAAPTTRTGSAPRPTPSSRAGPTARTRCSGISSAPPSSCAPSAARRCLPAPPIDRRRADRADMSDGFRRVAERDVHQGHVWQVVVAEFEGPDGQRFAARHRALARRGRRRAAGVRRRGQRRRWCCVRAVPPAVRARSSSRSRPGCATSTASRPRRPPARAGRGGRAGAGRLDLLDRVLPVAGHDRLGDAPSTWPPSCTPVERAAARTGGGALDARPPAARGRPGDDRRRSRSSTPRR